MAEEQVERFAQNGGIAPAITGFAVAALLVAAWAVDPHRVALWLPATGLLLASLVWAAIVRPRVLVTPGTLVLRNMLETIRIPLAAVEEVAVRQVMAVRVGDKRYVCPGAGRSMRQALKGSQAMRARGSIAGGGLSGLRAEMNNAVEPGMVYGDFVELRLRDLICEDRVRRDVRAYSADVEALAASVSREPAVLEIAMLAGSALLLVAAIVLG